MQPLQYDLRGPAAKENSITHAAAAPSNLDAGITVRSAEIELQSTIELRAAASEIAAPKPDHSAKAKKTILKYFLYKMIPEHRLLILINKFLKLLILYQNHISTIDFESLFSIAKTHPKIKRKNHVSD